jgi:hypothetical protein
MIWRAFGLIHQGLFRAFPGESFLSCRPCDLDTSQECALCQSILARVFPSHTLQIPWHITVILRAVGYSVCFCASRIFLEPHLASLSGRRSLKEAVLVGNGVRGMVRQRAEGSRSCNVYRSIIQGGIDKVRCKLSCHFTDRAAEAYCTC